MAFNETPVYSGAVSDKDWISDNLLNSLYVQRDVIANRPAQGNKGALFIASDEEERVYWDSGSAWVNLGELVTSATQTLAGNKTFSGVVDFTGAASTFTNIPVLPASNPTTDNQAARKKYVDDTVVNASAQSFVTVSNPTSETDGAIVNVTTLGGLVFFYAHIAVDTASPAENCTIRFRDPSGLFTTNTMQILFSAGSLSSLSTASSVTTITITGSTTAQQTMFLSAILKPTQTGNHKITFQFSGNAGSHSVRSIACWVL